MGLVPSEAERGKLSPDSEPVPLQERPCDDVHSLPLLLRGMHQ